MAFFMLNDLQAKVLFAFLIFLDRNYKKKDGFGVITGTACQQFYLYKNDILRIFGIESIAVGKIRV